MFEHTILFIDDDPGILNGFKRTFRKEKYNLLTAGNAKEAMALLEQHAVHLIVSDHKMPGTTGLDFFASIMSRYPDVVKIILTGQADMDMTIEAINSGCVYKFLLKPVNNLELMVTIRNALNRSEPLAENKAPNNSLKKQEGILNSLEKQYPGITNIPMDGIFRAPK